MQEEKIKISIVNYTNTLPFRWALKRSHIIDEIELQEDIPIICAQKLKYGQVDLALVPVALLPELGNYFIESDYCIGANGKVDSVKLYANVPLHKMKLVTLDYQSKSSITLTRILFRFFWKMEPTFVEAKPGFEEHINGDNAAVVIGDRTFDLNGKFAHEYDLSEEWKKYTGLPFVFAAWVSTKKLKPDFIEKFNVALKYGVDSIPSSITENSSNKNETLNYLTQRIDYHFDKQKRKALELFMELMAKL